MHVIDKVRTLHSTLPDSFSLDVMTSANQPLGDVSS